MPTQKHRIQAILEDDTYEKFKELCKIDDRTESKMASRIITEYISKYEKKNGNIVIGEINQSGSGNSININ